MFNKPNLYCKAKIFAVWLFVEKVFWPPDIEGYDQHKEAISNLIAFMIVMDYFVASFCYVCYWSLSWISELLEAVFKKVKRVFPNF